MWALILLLVAGCGDDDGVTPPADASEDAAGLDDAGRIDAPDEEDASAPSDAPVETDSGAPGRARLMYVAVNDESRLAVVELGTDGMMTPMTGRDLALPGQPAAMAYARTARRLYVGIGGDALATVALDTDGVPSLVGTTPGVGNPVYVETARAETVLVTAYFGEDRLATHDITGDPPHAALDGLATDDEPHAVRRGPGERFYVPHRNGNTVWVVEIAADGSLVRGSSIDADPGVGPRHVAFSRDGNNVYVINEYADSVTRYSLLADLRTLVAGETVPTLPAGTDGGANTCADVHVTPDGRFLYGSNRGHDSIAMFSIGGGGALTPLGNVDTQMRPREFDVSPDGRFVVAAGQDSGALESYRVEDDGTLTSVDVLDVGPDLRWVIID